MNRLIWMIWCAAVTLPMAGCGWKTDPSVRKLDDLEAVRRVNSVFLKATAEKNFAVMKASYADDAVMVLPNLEPMTGIAAITADYPSFAKDKAATFKPSSSFVSLSSDADLAFSRGEYISTYTNSSTGQVERARDYFLLLYRRQADGGWKIIQDVSSPLPDDPPERK